MVEQLSVSPKFPMATLLTAFGPNLEFGRELAPMTSYQTGGSARYFLTAVTAGDIVKSVKAARQLKIDYFLLGGGSNVLVSDSGFDGIVIKVDVRGIGPDGETGVRCGAGEDLNRLVDYATEHELSGMEFAAGIWGSVGGAIYGNAGAYGSSMSEVVKSVMLIGQDGEPKTADREYCRFGYRDSYLKTTQEVIVEATVSLVRGDRSKISSRVGEILALRKSKHPVDGKSAGCFFKNVPDASQPHGKLAAGRLLEEAGVKGLQVGGAKVFDKHANIIVNTGNASAKDIRQLADIMKKKVLDKFGIALEEEVIQIGTI